MRGFTVREKRSMLAGSPCWDPSRLGSSTGLRDGITSQGVVFAYTAFMKRARLGARLGRLSSIACREHALNAFLASIGTMT